MAPILHIAATIALLSFSACTNSENTQPGPPTPTALQLTITGTAEPVLGDDGTGRIGLVRDGTAEPIAVEFENGAMVITDLQPGQYSIATLGLLTCRGLTFEVDKATSARALGSLRAEIITTDYYVALISRKAATGAEITRLAERTQSASGAIDARPIDQTEAAPCFLGTGGPGTTWRDRPLGEQILLGIGFAGFCAIALASGGFCAF